MFMVFLRFSDNRAEAKRHIQGHNEWLAHGFDEGVFLLSGSLQPTLGGGILAHNTSRAELERRVASDPFVVQNVVRAEIFELTPSKTDPRLDFMLT